MRLIRNWIAMPGISLALLALVLSASPARLSVSSREAAIEGATPGARLTLFDGVTPIGGAVAGPSGRARFGEFHLSPGDHVLRVTEWGTGWGVGDPVHVSVQAPRAKGLTPATVALSSSANPSFFGQPLTLHAAVTPSSATGTVTFYDGTMVLGIVAVKGGAASLTSVPPSGTQPFKAYYSGDTVYAASTSLPLSQTIRVAPQNGFGPAFNISTAHPLRSLAIADFNGDGAPDAAVGNALLTAEETVSILLASPGSGSPGPSFQLKSENQVGDSPFVIAAADFNGDGKLDMAVANGASATVSILLGNGDGTFSTATGYGVGSVPKSMTLADFNGDGKVDIAVVNFTSGSVSVLLSNGDGTFQSAANFPCGNTPLSIASADFNGDGNADLAVANDGAQTVAVLLGDGTGGFSAPVRYASNSLYSLAAADLNGDGKPDIVGANTDGQFVSVLLGNGDGTFQPPVEYSAGISPFSIVVGDFNGDGRSDLAVTNAAHNQVSILSGTRDGSFSFAGSYSVGDPKTFAGDPVSESTHVMVVTDLNGDGRSDLVILGLNTVSTSAGSFSILLGVPNYLATTTTLSSTPNPSVLGRPVTLTATVTPASAPGTVTFYDGATVLGTGVLSAGVATFTTALLPADVRQLKAHYQGNLEFAGSDSSTLAQTVIALPADGFPPAVAINGGMQLSSMTSGDFNGDGIPDLAVTDKDANQVRVLLGRGDGTFRSAVVYAAGNSPTSVAVGDFDGDGKQDLAVTATQQIGIGTGLKQFGLNILFGNGDGTFQQAVGFDTGNAPSFVVAADFNGDGKTDLAVANAADNNVSVLLGNGDGTFQSITYQSGVPPAMLQERSAVALLVGDFNGDGITDLLVVGRFAQVSLGNGDGTFRASYVPNTGAVFSATVGDFNGDGKLDFVLCNADPTTDNDPLANVFLGNGDGTFLGKDGPVLGHFLYALAIGDFNGDGIPDLAFADDSLNVGIFLGNGRDGTFQPAVTYPLVNLPASLVVADFNSDGRSDLAAATVDASTVSIFLGVPAIPTQVTLQTSPPGLAISVDGGIPVATPVTLPLTKGLHTIAAPSFQAGPAGERFVFDHWSDGGVASHQITVLPTAATYTAFFGAQFLLTTSVQPPGAGTIAVTVKSPVLDGYYNPGTGVTVTASPAAGYSFSGFSGSLTGTTNPQLLSMSAPAAVTANFTAIPPVQNPTIFGAIGTKTTQGSTTTVTLVLTNVGAGAAQSLALTSLTAAVLTGTGSVAIAGPAIPYSGGMLQPAGVANVPVQLTITGTVSRVRLLFGGTMQNTAGVPLMFSGAAQVPIP